MLLNNLPTHSYNHHFLLYQSASVTKIIYKFSVLENMSRLVASDLPSGVLHEDVEIYKETRKRAINVILPIFN